MTTSYWSPPRRRARYIAVVDNAMSSSSTSLGGRSASGRSGVATTPMLAVTPSGVAATAPRMRSASGVASGVVKVSATRNSASPTGASRASRRTVSRSTWPTAMRTRSVARLPCMLCRGANVSIALSAITK